MESTVKKSIVERRNERMRSLYPWWDKVMEVLGDKSIYPGDEYIGQEFTGSWIDQNFKRWSIEKKLAPDASAEVARSRAVMRAKYLELSKMEGRSAEAIVAALSPDIVAQLGAGDQAEATQKLVEVFRHLRKSELNEQVREEEDTAKKHEKTENKELQLTLGEKVQLHGKRLLRTVKKLAGEAWDEHGKRTGKSWCGTLDDLFVDADKVKLSTWKDKSKGLHFKINDLCVSEEVFNYARHLKAGGGSMADKVMEFLAKGTVSETAEAVGGGTAAALPATGTDGGAVDGSDLPF